MPRGIELTVAAFALLLNFPREILQAPLFAGMADGPYIDAIRGCTQATLGDALITLAVYLTVSSVSARRAWILAPTPWQVALFLAVGILVTIAIELLALRGAWVQSWNDSPAMPVVPGIGVGLSPQLQWLVLPLLVLWLVRRQLSPRTQQALTIRAPT